MGKTTRDSYHKGRRDGEKGKFRPPDGTSLGAALARQVLGSTRSDQAYRKGHKHGKKPR